MSVNFGIPNLPFPENLKLTHYEPGSVDRVKLIEALNELKTDDISVPVIINNEEYRIGEVKYQLMPEDQNKAVCSFYEADAEYVNKAIEGCLDAKERWEQLNWVNRLAIFQKAAHLLVTKYRYRMMAATMLGQGKTAWQGEIDCIAEAYDFLKFNSFYCSEIYKDQPLHNSLGVWNRQEYRPLEGFVVAITPFNFTAIGINLCTSPAMMGNVVVWKPSRNAILSSYLMYKILMEAGLPAGVIQFVPCSGSVLSDQMFARKTLSGIHFTGSTATFKTLLHKAYSADLQSFPRIVGETGGKNFHFIAPDVDMTNCLNNCIRGAFEYQGQKCSATSRIYCPRSRWEELRTGLVQFVDNVKIGSVSDLGNFMNAVIHQRSYDKIKKYIDDAKSADCCEIVAGGRCLMTDSQPGLYIQPTVILTEDIDYVTMKEEIFGPVVTVFVYNDEDMMDVARHAANSSSYALTGSVFASNRQTIDELCWILRHAAGNFYINDKSTGAVVGQQAFGGARGSGTNDKAGSAQNLLRWVSSQSIKENFCVLEEYGYPHMN
eukprot:TRINITY_DN445_c0_g1_i1.p1 TRINITY_DN445_c0_g1~~TRINITY_DN445_c0_g1_i1.p1  ORF type:complete len:554 (+),score=152.06 TRINITY_DN445_c0_g1_i1:25-1662(+)